MTFIVTYQILGALFLLIMVYLTFVTYKRKHLSRLSTYFWIIVWTLGFFAMIFKDVFQIFLPNLAIYRIFDLYTIIGFMFFLFMIFYLFKTVKENQKKIEKLTRIIALKPLNNKIKKD